MKNFLRYVIAVLIFPFLSVYPQNGARSNNYTINYGGAEERISLFGDTENGGDEKVNVTVTSGSLMNFLWVTTDTSKVYWGFSPNGTHSFTFELSPGTYNLLTRTQPMDVDKMVLYYKKITIRGGETISIDFTESNKFKKIRLLREDGTHMNNTQRVLYFYLTAKPNLGLVVWQIVISSEDYSIPDLKIFYNKLPQTIAYEFVAGGNEYVNDGKNYLVTGKFTSAEDTLITNSPDSLQRNVFHFYLPSKKLNVNNVVIYYGGKFGLFPFSHEQDFPVSIELYNNTDIFSRECLMAKKSLSIESRAAQGSSFLLNSSPMFFDENMVIGYLRINDEDGLILSDDDEVKLGMTPIYWYGKFVNKESEIAINSDWTFIDSSFSHLFLSQTNDALPRPPITMQVKNSEDSTIVDKQLGQYSVYNGYSNDAMRTSVSAGIYTVTFTNVYDYLLDTIRCNVTVINKFDTRLTDKNPPRFKAFQILGDGSVSHELYSDQENKVRFWAEDETNIDTVKFYYKETNDTAWNEIATTLDERFYYVSLPELNSGEYSLKVYLADSFGNGLTMLQEPAFIYHKVVSADDENVLPKKFELYQNYPNPFNPVTTRKYSIPTNVGGETHGRASLRIYNVLGEEITTLVNERQAPGEYSVQFDASDLPSGVYFYTLRVGDFVSTKKMILLK